MRNSTTSSFWCAHPSASAAAAADTVFEEQPDIDLPDFLLDTTPRGSSSSRSRTESFVAPPPPSSELVGIMGSTATTTTTNPATTNTTMNATGVNAPAHSSSNNNNNTTPRRRRAHSEPLGFWGDSRVAPVPGIPTAPHPPNRYRHRNNSSSLYRMSFPLHSANSDDEKDHENEQNRPDIENPPEEADTSTTPPRSTIHPTRNTPSREQYQRIRWIQINTRFQIVITCVAIVFSLLLFAILLAWIYMAMAYFFTLSCNTALQTYFWLATFQLILDVFRSDILQLLFQYDGSTTNHRIPCKVMAYNICYLIYAMLVLRLGGKVIVVEHSSFPCSTWLYQATTIYFSLNLAAWATILGGYLLPFCIVAALLTHNGYDPAGSYGPSTTTPSDLPFSIPAAYRNHAAPPGTIDRLTVVNLSKQWNGSTSCNAVNECSICIETFTSRDCVVETHCKHLFHKECARSWLRQARTCPVCRSDLVTVGPTVSSSSVGSAPTNHPNHSSTTTEANSPELMEQQQQQQQQQQQSSAPSRIPMGPTGRPVVGFLRLLLGSNTISSATGPHQRGEMDSTGTLEDEERLQELFIPNRSNRAYTS